MGSFTFHHLGVAVPGIDQALRTYTDTLGYRVLSGPFDDPIQRVRVCFVGNVGEKLVIELIAPIAGDSPIAGILAKGQGAYHVCYEVADLDSTMTSLRGKGWVIVAQPAPAVAFSGRRIAWLFAPTRQLIELVEARSQTR